MGIIVPARQMHWRTLVFGNCFISIAWIVILYIKTPYSTIGKESGRGVYNSGDVSQHYRITIIMNNHR